MELKAIILFTEFPYINYLYRAFDGEYFVEEDDVQAYLAALGTGAYTIIERTTPLPPLPEPLPEDSPIWVLINNPSVISNGLRYDGVISFTESQIGNIGNEVFAVNKVGAFRVGNYIIAVSRKGTTVGMSKFGKIIAINSNNLTIAFEDFEGNGSLESDEWDILLTGKRGLSSFSILPNQSSVSLDSSHIGRVLFVYSFNTNLNYINTTPLPAGSSFILYNAKETSVFVQRAGMSNASNTEIPAHSIYLISLGGGSEVTIYPIKGDKGDKGDDGIDGVEGTKIKFVDAETDFSDARLRDIAILNSTFELLERDEQMPPDSVVPVPYWKSKGVLKGTNAFVILPNQNPFNLDSSHLGRTLYVDFNHTALIHINTTPLPAGSSFILYNAKDSSVFVQRAGMSNASNTEIPAHSIYLISLGGGSEVTIYPLKGEKGDNAFVILPNQNPFNLDSSHLGRTLYVDFNHTALIHINTTPLPAGSSFILYNAKETSVFVQRAGMSNASNTEIPALSIYLISLGGGSEVTIYPLKGDKGDKGDDGVSGFMNLSGNGTIELPASCSSKILYVSNNSTITTVVANLLSVNDTFILVNAQNTSIGAKRTTMFPSITIPAQTVVIISVVSSTALLITQL